MKYNIVVDVNSQIPFYKQLIDTIERSISDNLLSDGDFLPSMNELSKELDISKETVKKSYGILRAKGLIDSAHGKGFYITKVGNHKKKVLLLFDKISSYKQVLYSSLEKEIGTNTEITIRLHNQDIELFERFIEDNLDKFDYYIITPHFPLNDKVQKRLSKTLKKIPNRKLILLDHTIPTLQGNFGAVYQRFEKDIFDGLVQASKQLKKFKKLNIISMPGSLYAPLIVNGIKNYCNQYDLDFHIYNDLNLESINKNEVYLILNSQLDVELIQLIKIAKSKGYKIGQDIGIISYNESPINEIILDGLTVFSTDFEEMGKLAAKMITDQSLKKISCPFHLISRNTF